MTYTPITPGTINWDVPVNAAFVDQDTRITTNASVVSGKVSKTGDTLTGTLNNTATLVTDVTWASIITGDSFDRFRILSTGTQQFGPGSGARDTTWGRTGVAQVGSSDSEIVVGLAGKGLSIKEGTNGRIGQATLTAGTVTVANAVVTATSRVYVTRRFIGGTPGFESVSVTSGSFTISSSNAADTSGFNYFIVQPSP